MFMCDRKFPKMSPDEVTEVLEDLRRSLVDFEKEPDLITQKRIIALDEVLKERKVIREFLKLFKEEEER